MDIKQAEHFFNEWLRISPKRKTDGLGWPRAYKKDAISMIVDAFQQAAKVEVRKKGDNGIS